MAQPPKDCWATKLNGTENETDVAGNPPAKRNGLLRIVRGFSIVAAIGTGVALFARFNWIADALSHFAIQFSILLLIGLFVSLACRRWKSSLLFGCCLTINLLPVAPYLLSSLQGPSDASGKLTGKTYRLISFNVLRTNDDVQATLDDVLAEDPDFIYLMEVHGKWKEPCEKLLAEYPFQKIVSRQSYVGVAFLSKHPWREMEVYDLGDIGNPTIDVQFNFPGNDRTLRLIGTHPVPPFGDGLTQSRDTQLTDLAERFDGNQANLLIGDFNLSPWSPRFAPILSAGNLSDASLGYSLSPTLAPLPTLFGGLKVDHVLKNDNVGTVEFQLKSGAGSDHKMLIFDFELK